MTTLERLTLKANGNNDVKMPSISQISKMLTEYGIEHTVENTQNVVEYRSKGRRYVNSRHMGKKGKELQVQGLYMDTSESYYSCNTLGYAQRLIQIINDHKKQ